VELFLIWLVASVIIGWGGTQKGRSFFFGFGWSVVLSPILGLLIVALSGKKDSGGDTPGSNSSTVPSLKDQVIYSLEQRGFRLDPGPGRDQFDRWFDSLDGAETSSTVLADMYEDSIKT